MRPKVRHVAVMTKNREKMVDFYQKIFGLEPKRGFGGAIYMSDGDVNIALIEVKREDQKEGINHIGFEVDDLDDIKRRLQEAGFDSEIDAKSDKDSDHRIQDPDGHWVDTAVQRRWPKEEEIGKAARRKGRWEGARNARLKKSDSMAGKVKALRKLGRWMALLGLLVATVTPGAVYSQDSQSQKTVEAARKEGEVVWYTTMSSDQSNAFMARFQQKYPFLKPSVTRLGGSALLNRIVTEAKAGKNFFDVAHGTGEIVLPLMEMGLLAPYLSPERKMIPEDLKDKKGFWTSVYVNSVVLGYNTNLVKGQPIPRTYNDLLQPRWKGRKISIDDTYATFLQGLISTWGKDKALDYLKKLAEQDPVVMRGSTVRVQLAAAGEFPLVIAYANIIQYLAEKGAPVDWVPLDPAVISVNTVMAGAP